MQKTHTIGVILCDILNPIYTAVIRVLEDAILPLGYNVVLCNNDEDTDKEIGYLKVH